MTPPPVDAGGLHKRRLVRREDGDRVAARDAELHERRRQPRRALRRLRIGLHVRRRVRRAESRLPVAETYAGVGGPHRCRALRNVSGVNAAWFAARRARNEAWRATDSVATCGVFACRPTSRPRPIAPTPTKFPDLDRCRASYIQSGVGPSRPACARVPRSCRPLVIIRFVIRRPRSASNPWWKTSEWPRSLLAGTGTCASSLRMSSMTFL